MSDYIWELGLRIGILRVEYSISIFLIDQLFNMIKEIYLLIDIKILFLINIGIFFVKKNLMEFILHCYQYSSLLFSSNNLKFACVLDKLPFSKLSSNCTYALSFLHWVEYALKTYLLSSS